MSAQTRSEISELLDRHGLVPAHHLGQHFLADANITRKIAGLAALVPGDRVLEVGAGTGTLTAALAASGARVVAYEIDPALAPVLAEVTEGLGVEIRFEDVMEVDLATELEGGPWTLVANLPYNVGTPLILRTLQEVPVVEKLVVMVQLEVAERLVAGPGSKSYGIPSVISSLHARTRIAATVPRQVFVPPPNVDSAVVVMERIVAPELAPVAIDLARHAFSKRRKMLRSSLADRVADVADVCRRAGVDPTSRPESLSAAEFLRLAEESI